MNRRGELLSRLLTLDEAAAYLSLPLATTRKLGIGRVRLGTKTRYDRVALDHHLDGLAGLAPQSLETTGDDAEAALDRFAQRFAHAPGRA